MGKVSVYQSWIDIPGLAAHVRAGHIKIAPFNPDETYVGDDGQAKLVFPNYQQNAARVQAQIAKDEAAKPAEQREREYADRVAAGRRIVTRFAAVMYRLGIYYDPDMIRQVEDTPGWERLAEVERRCAISRAWDAFTRACRAFYRASGRSFNHVGPPVALYMMENSTELPDAIWITHRPLSLSVPPEAVFNLPPPYRKVFLDKIRSISGNVRIALRSGHKRAVVLNLATKYNRNRIQAQQKQPPLDAAPREYGEEDTRVIEQAAREIFNRYFPDAGSPIYEQDELVAECYIIAAEPSLRGKSLTVNHLRGRLQRKVVDEIRRRQHECQLPDNDPTSSEEAHAHAIDRIKYRNSPRVGTIGLDLIGLTPRQMEIASYLMERPDATDQEIASHLKSTQSTVNRDRAAIRKWLLRTTATPDAGRKIFPRAQKTVCLRRYAGESDSRFLERVRESMQEYATSIFVADQKDLDKLHQVIDHIRKAGRTPPMVSAA